MQVVETIAEVRRIRAGAGRELGAGARRWVFCTPGMFRWSSGRGRRTIMSASRSS